MTFLEALPIVTLGRVFGGFTEVILLLNEVMLVSLMLLTSVLLVMVVLVPLVKLLVSCLLRLVVLAPVEEFEVVMLLDSTTDELLPLGVVMLAVLLVRFSVVPLVKVEVLKVAVSFIKVPLANLAFSKLVPLVEEFPFGIVMVTKNSDMIMYGIADPSGLVTRVVSLE